MKYVYSLPRKDNTVLHVFQAEARGEQPGNLGVGEIAEISDRALTVCQRFLKKYEVVEEAPDGMTMCKLCTDEEAIVGARKWGQIAWEKKNEGLPDALAATKALLKGLKKKK